MKVYIVIHYDYGGNEVRAVFLSQVRAEEECEKRGMTDHGWESFDVLDAPNGHA
jgi:hypothetical protein